VFDQGRLGDGSDRIEVRSPEGAATPRLAMKLDVQLLRPVFPFRDSF
jgi:hypothetical protein